MSDKPKISIVIETLNATPESRIELGDVLARLREQTYPADRLEPIVVLEEGNTELATFVETEHPEARAVWMSEPGYYGMKLAGAEAATGDVIAFLDSDCLPGETWASEIVATLTDGADVVAGKVRFPPGARCARTFELFNYGHIRNGPDGSSPYLNVSNVAFQRDVFTNHPFDARLRRSGGGALLGQRLTALGYRIVYNPRLRAVHNDPGLRTHVTNRLRTGYESINLCRLDEDRVLPESRYLSFGALAPFILAARRLSYDLGTLRSNRSDLDIRAYEIPYFIGASCIVRGAEAISGLITMKFPQIAERAGW